MKEEARRLEGELSKAVDVVEMSLHRFGFL